MANPNDSFTLNIAGDSKDVSVAFMGIVGGDETVVKFKVSRRDIKAALPAMLNDVSKRFSLKTAPISKLAHAVNSLSAEQVAKMFVAESGAFQRMMVCLTPDQIAMFADALQDMRPTDAPKPRSSKKSSKTKR